MQRIHWPKPWACNCLAVLRSPRIVDMVWEGMRPSDIGLNLAIGGSTNAPSYLNAIVRHLPRDSH